MDGHKLITEKLETDIKCCKNQQVLILKKVYDLIGQISVPIIHEYYSAELKKIPPSGY